MLKKLLNILLILAAVLVAAVAVVWFARPADVSFDELKATIPHSEISKFAEIDGVRIHYQEKGTGVPLVLIHGYTSSIYTWKDVLDPLAAKYHVIAVDLKGFGFSEKPSGDYTRRAQGELVAHLLDYLKIEKAWIAGNSMGGEVVLNVALNHPDKVLGMILIDSAGIQSVGHSSLAPWYLQTPIVGRVLTALFLTSDKLVRRGLKKSFFDDSKIDEDRVRYYYEPLKTRAGQLAAIEARNQFDQYPIENDLGSINLPTLIIWGADDEVIPIEAGRRMNSLITGSKFVIFDQCGHVPQEEMPERVLDSMTEFIGLNTPAEY